MRCKECIHQELCADYVSSLAEVQNADIEYISQWLDEIEGRKEQADNACEHFKDRSRFVELPCNVGETVYFISCEKIQKDVVLKLDIYNDCIQIRTNEGWTLSPRCCYFSRKEAKQALKERENNAE